MSAMYPSLPDQTPTSGSGNVDRRSRETQAVILSHPPRKIERLLAGRDRFDSLAAYPCLSGRPGPVVAQARTLQGGQPVEPGGGEVEHRIKLKT
jgi:hypothetical protein